MAILIRIPRALVPKKSKSATQKVTSTTALQQQEQSSASNGSKSRRRATAPRRCRCQRRDSSNSNRRCNSNSTRNKGDHVHTMGGVFVSTRALLMHRQTIAETASYGAVELNSTSSGAASHLSSTSGATTITTKIATASSQTKEQLDWKSSGSHDHNKNSPLIVNDPDSIEAVQEGSGTLSSSSSASASTSASSTATVTASSSLDEAEALGLRMARSRHLPETWYYSSNHIMVNQERARRTIAPLMRIQELDTLARKHAQDMADANELYYMAPDEIQEALEQCGRSHTRRLGANVACGNSIREIHWHMLDQIADKNNMLDRRFTQFGMATAKCVSTGKLYMCQIYRG